MALPLSPGIQVREFDISTVLTQASTSPAAFVGGFTYGPVEEVVTVANKQQLINRFGTPTDENYVDWFSAANFLDYSSNLKVVRVINEEIAANATTHDETYTDENGDLQDRSLIIKNQGDWTLKYDKRRNYEVKSKFAGRFPSELMNGIKISMADATSYYSLTGVSVLNQPKGYWISWETAKKLYVKFDNIKFLEGLREFRINTEGNKNKALKDATGDLVEPGENLINALGYATEVTDYKTKTDVDIVKFDDNNTASWATEDFKTTNKCIVTNGSDNFSYYIGTFIDDAAVKDKNPKKPASYDSLKIKIDEDTAIPLAGNEGSIKGNERYDVKAGNGIPAEGSEGYIEALHKPMTDNEKTWYEYQSYLAMKKDIALIKYIEKKYIAAKENYEANRDVTDAIEARNPSVRITWAYVDGDTTKTVISTPTKNGTTITNDYSDNTLDGNTKVRISSINIVTERNGIVRRGIGLERLPTASLKTVDSNTNLGDDGKNVNSVTFRCRHWAYANQFSVPPGTSNYAANRNGKYDELHIVVIDGNGTITGQNGAILERYSGVSKAVDAVFDDGSQAYYPSVLRDQSEYVYWLNHPYETDNWSINPEPSKDTKQLTTWGNKAQNTHFDGMWYPPTYTLSGGNDGISDSDGQYAITLGDKISAWSDLLSDPETVDYGIIISGGNTPNGEDREEYAAYQSQLIELAESRMDCVVCLSPYREDVLMKHPLETIIQYRNDSLKSSSYAFMDNNWKYQYDRYNDKYRWLPCNPDIAGLMARTDYDYDPWWSPAGFNRGALKNVVKIAWATNSTDRDELYSNGINAVCTFLNEGTILYGDKTLQTKVSAFDRINVRRLFIVLEKTIAQAARYSLFEFNDEFTRTRFRMSIDPFLRQVQGGRGIIDYQIVCDESNNTPQVIDNNAFVGAIYVKPNKSINFIQLNFVCVATSVSFSEVVGTYGSF